MSQQQQQQQLQQQQQQKIKSQIMALKKSIGKGSASKQVVKQVKSQIQELEDQLKNIKVLDSYAEQPFDSEKFECNPLENQEREPLNNIMAGEDGSEPIDENQMETKEGKEDKEDLPNQRVRKSKKKKNKKMMQLEKDRLLAAEEAKNMPNPKELEDLEISNLAKNMNRSIFEVAADGHCLYNSIARQLHLIDEGFPSTFTYQNLRKLAVSWIRDHQKDFLPFLVNDKGDMMNQGMIFSYFNPIENDQMNLTNIATIVNLELCGVDNLKFKLLVKLLKGQYIFFRRDLLY